MLRFIGKTQAVGTVVRSLRCSSTLNTGGGGGDLKVKLSPDGKELSLSPQPSLSSSYHVKWLRHNCQCSDCISSSGQKTVTAHHLIRDNSIERVKLEGMLEWQYFRIDHKIYCMNCNLLNYLVRLFWAKLLDDCFACWLAFVCDLFTPHWWYAVIVMWSLHWKQSTFLSSLRW